MHFSREQSEALVKLVTAIHDRVMTDVATKTDLQQQMQRQSDVFQRHLQQQTETLKELLQSHFDAHREQLHAIAADVKVLDASTNDLVREIGTMKDGVKRVRNLSFAQTALVISFIGGLATFFGGVFSWKAVRSAAAGDGSRLPALPTSISPCGRPHHRWLTG